MLLGIILSLGLFLRIYQLTQEKFFAFSSMADVGNLCNYWFSVGHFPTFFLIKHYWIKIFGTGMFAVHSLPIICGILSVYVIFLLGKELYGAQVGLLSGYFFAVSTIHIFHSQFYGLYTMVNLFVLLSCLFFLKVLFNDKVKFWLGYILFTLLALFLSYSTLPMLVCQILCIILLPVVKNRLISIKKIAVVFGSILIIYLPILIRLIKLIIQNNYRIALLDWLAPPSIGTVLNIFSLFNGKSYNEFHEYMLKESFGFGVFTNIYGVILFLLCLVGIFNSFKLRKNSDKAGRVYGLFLSLWLVIPIVLPFIYSRCLTPVFGPVRYILYVSCAYYLLISKGIMSFNKKIRIFLIFFVVFGGSLFLREYYYNVPIWEKVDKESLGPPRLKDPLMFTYSGSVIQISGEIVFKEYKDQIFRLSVRSPLHPYKYGPPDIAAETYYSPGPYNIKVPRNCGDIIMMVTVWDKKGFEPEKRWPYSAFKLKVDENNIEGVNFIIK